MDDRYYDEHYEDDLPVVSLPTPKLIKKTNNYNYEPYNAANNHPNNLLDSKLVQQKQNYENSIFILFHL